MADHRSQWPCHAFAVVRAVASHAPWLLARPFRHVASNRTPLLRGRLSEAAAACSDPRRCLTGTARAPRQSRPLQLDISYSSVLFYRFRVAVCEHALLCPFRQVHHVAPAPHGRVPESPMSVHSDSSSPPPVYSVEEKLASTMGSQMGSSYGSDSHLPGQIPPSPVPVRATPGLSPSPHFSSGSSAVGESRDASPSPASGGSQQSRSAASQPYSQSQSPQSLLGPSPTVAGSTTPTPPHHGAYPTTLTAAHMGRTANPQVFY